MTILQSIANPWGSTIKNKIISAPTTMNSKCAAISTGQPNCKTITFLSKTGIKTKNAAPNKDPRIEPKPPIIIIKSIRKDFSIPKASPTSIAPKYTENQSAPAIPT